MPSTYSTNLRLENIGNGEQTGTWGDTTDANICTLLEEAISGVSAVVMPSNADYTLTALNAVTDEARQAVLQVTSGVSLTATRDVICPTVDKVYIVYNNTTGSQSIRIKTAAGSGITIPSGKKRLVYCDGTNVVDSITDLASGTQVGGVDVVTISGSQTLINKTITSPIISVGDASLSIFDNATPAKILQLELSGMASATGILTMPSFTGNAATMVSLDASQVLTNKTLTSPTITVRDNVFTIQDQGDTTKQAQFQASSITTATTRTYTLPDSDGTVLLTDGVGSSLTGIRKQGKETVWYPASAMVAPVTTGAAVGTTEGTNFTYKTLDFDANEIAYMSVAMPKSWSIATTLGFIPYWTATAGSGTAIFTFTAIALSNDDVLDTATGGTQTSTDTLITINDLHIGPECSGLTPNGTPAAEDLIVIKIVRTGTIANAVKLLGVKMIYTTNASDDT